MYYWSSWEDSLPAMEMDFLGVHSPLPPSPAKGGDEGLVMQWPYKSVVFSQKFMPLKASHDGYETRDFVPQIPSHAANLNLFGANQILSWAPLSQRSHKLNKLAGWLHSLSVQRRAHPTNTQTHPVVPNCAFAAAITESCLNRSISAPTLGEEATVVAPSPATIGMFPARTAKLTIAYADSVVVFDNVSREKAKQLMILAAKASQASNPAVCPALAQLESPAGLKIMPMDSSQSRKTSLARFLERRKQRIVSVAPYSVSSENKNLLGSMERSWTLGEPDRSASYGKESPSTLLKI